MWVWVDRECGVLLDASISAALLWALVALAILGCRQPARRLQLGRAAMLGSLALLPLIGLDLVPRFNVISAIHDVGLLASPLPTPRSLPTRPARSPQPLPAVGHAPEPFPIPGGRWALRVTAGVYAAGVGCGLAWLGLGWGALAWLTRQTSEPSPEARALYESLPFESVMPRPSLRVAARVGRPVLVGSIRTLILIPPNLDRPETRDRFRLSLLHELAHAEGGDPAFGLLGSLAQSVWFFIPTLWWVAAQMRLDQEFLADRRASLRFGQARAYASSLLDLAWNRSDGDIASELNNDEDADAGIEAIDASPRFSTLDHPTDVPLTGQGSPLFQRVLMLLQCPFPVEPRPPVWWSWAMPILAILLTLGVSSLSIRPGPKGVEPARTHRFEMASLSVPAFPLGPNGRSPRFELPLQLPEKFDLTVEVWGDPSTLAGMRVAGVRLDALVADPEDAPERWHTVRIRRDDSGVVLSMDGHLATEPISSHHLTTWLSVETAPTHRGDFRRLHLRW